MKRVLAVSSVAMLSLAAACSSSGDEAASTSVPVETTAPVTTTTEPETTTTEAETTTIIDPLSEEAVAEFMDQYFSFVWDEQNMGHGRMAQERDVFFADPLLGRSQASLAERIASNRFRRGTLTGDVLAIAVSGTEASVDTCVTDAVGLYEADGTVVVPPDDFDIRFDHRLRYIDGAWKIYEFYVGEECQR